MRARVDFPVPDASRSKLSVGLPIELRADAHPGRTFNAKVAGIDSRVDVATRAVMVRAELDNRDGLVRPGMLMRVALLQAAADALVVPELAIQQVGSRTFVFVADAEAKASSRDVRVGSRRGGEVVVLDGLKPGEVVVVEGTSKLRDGQKLDVVAASAKTAAP